MLNEARKPGRDLYPALLEAIPPYHAWKEASRCYKNMEMPGLGLNQGRVAPGLGFLGSFSSNFQSRHKETATPPRDDHPFQ